VSRPPESSDSDRHARELRYAQTAEFDAPLELEHGGRLPSVTVVYETYGHLNPQRDNAVLVCHALSGDSHVAQHDADDDPGWWDVVVGPGKPIDTDHYFVICPNVLGGCRGTTGPSTVNPTTGKPYGPDFPVVTVGDIVRVQRRLVDSLGIERLRTVVGGSLGGHMALDWATRYPDRLDGAVAVATSPRPSSQAIAFDVIGRNAIMRDPDYRAGQYYEGGPGPSVGLALARMLGHITYLSHEAMTQKFDAARLQPRDVRSQFETKFSVGSYLAYQGDRFVDRFDPNSYLTLTMAMDLFDLGDTPEALTAAFARSQCRWLVVSFSSDWLFPAFQSLEVVNALIAAEKPVSFCNVQSDCGHDAFLLPNEVDQYGEMIRSFLANVTDRPGADSTACCQSPDAACCEVGDGRPTSIFRAPHRFDYDSIVELIPPEDSVLDLGCGNGSLLSRLRQSGHRRLMGLELDQGAILAAIRRGFDVVQGDLNDGLSAFGDGQFDVVVLSQTLQAVIDVPRVIDEMLRVGRRGIVSFPNLGYRPWRDQLSDEGRAPHVGFAVDFNWYDTPNVRQFTIADFEDFCRRKGIRVHRRLALNTEWDRQVDENPNLDADVAIMVLSLA